MDVFDNDLAGVSLINVTGLVTRHKGHVSQYRVVLNTMPMYNVSVGVTFDESALVVEVMLPALFCHLKIGHNAFLTPPTQIASFLLCPQSPVS